MEENVVLNKIPAKDTDMKDRPDDRRRRIAAEHYLPAILLLVLLLKPIRNSFKVASLSQPSQKRQRIRVSIH